MKNDCDRKHELCVLEVIITGASAELVEENDTAFRANRNKSAPAQRGDRRKHSETSVQFDELRAILDELRDGSSHRNGRGARFVVSLRQRAADVLPSALSGANYGVDDTEDSDRHHRHVQDELVGCSAPRSAMYAPVLGEQASRPLPDGRIIGLQR